MFFFIVLFVNKFSQKHIKACFWIITRSLGVVHSGIYHDRRLLLMIHAFAFSFGQKTSWMICWVSLMNFLPNSKVHKPFMGTKTFVKI